MDLSDYFDAVGEDLKNSVTKTRATLSHSGNKGTQAEAAFRDFLRKHLPRSFDVGHGEIIDRAGSVVGSRQEAGQIDVIVFDESHPRFVEVETPGLYLIEGVVASAEVKMSLQLSDVEEIIGKAAAFKRLRPTIGHGDDVVSTPSDVERFVNRRPYFLFAYESATPIDSFYSRMIEVQNALGLGDTDHLDAVFMLDRGTILNLGDGQGFTASRNPDGTLISGWLREPKPVMVSLISWLSIVTPMLMHRSAILTSYLVRTINQPTAVVAPQSIAGPTPSA